jgi:hypothetical protein
MRFIHASDLHIDSPLRGLDGFLDLNDIPRVPSELLN